MHRSVLCATAIVVAFVGLVAADGRRWRDSDLGLQPSTDFLDMLWFDSTPFSLARFAVEDRKKSSKHYPKTKSQMLSDWRAYLQRRRVMEMTDGRQIDE